MTTEQPKTIVLAEYVITSRFEVPEGVDLNDYEWNVKNDKLYIGEDIVIEPTMTIDDVVRYQDFKRPDRVLEWDE